MPLWYVVTSYVVRILGFGLFLFCAWHFTRFGGSTSPWLFAGILGGVLLMALPSLPKALIEQRNRLRGLRDGTLNEHFERMEEEGS